MNKNAREGERIANFLRDAERAFIPFASRAIGRILVALEALVEPYPPQPDRDRASTFNTYVRGIGQFPRSAFKRDIKAPGGFKVSRKVKTGTIKLTSQQMDRKFHTEVRTTEKEVIGRHWNEATYSGYVLGPAQVPWHRATGWANRDEVLDLLQPQIDEEKEAAVEEFMSGLRG